MRTIEKIIQGKFDKFWLWFVVVAFFFKIIFSEKSQVHQMTQNDLECYKAKGTIYMLNYDPWVPNFTPFCFTIARFPDNWAFFYFFDRLQWWIWNFQKKIMKNWKLKISKIPRIVLWGPLGGKFRISSKTFECDL